MRATRQLSITLPQEMAVAVRQRVESGDYASDSEVVREGLRALAERERAVEHWLRTDVVSAYEKLRADPSRARTIAQVREKLRHTREAIEQE
ncbi:type II toxin-antitoxin system ParD family antitoxin [Sphingomonas sp. MAH-20]|uniref:Type II toxin-antitoxin system ParD family antitoxin n=1 Tax=Sphingomonas horti TaxID=2682842 RepID=A0A6I4J1M1_9SPHN|nr:MULTISPECIES: type II toxin-antitoxin system ParD family antitoxin [Sphingomonas]MBA2919315.1 type II toxin-antitoxin system ParD family antitoxin [Sphingomonas sp. CGMCC 1.13658]MVO78196.1 type II toxin-antitoxin system ParD family antitoxin [Sphingomonas horti]